MTKNQTSGPKKGAAVQGSNQVSKRGSDRANPDNRQDKLSKRLDEGLEETFPSSDPVAVKITK